MVYFLIFSHHSLSLREVRVEAMGQSFVLACSLCPSVYNQRLLQFHDCVSIQKHHL